MEKTAGITCDNYKIEKFKKELKANGFDNFTVVPFKENLSIIKVICQDTDYGEIAKICRGVEEYFMAMKN